MRKKESVGVIAKMRKAIDDYGLTAADLGLDGAVSGGASARRSAKAVSPSSPRKGPPKKAAAKKLARPGAGVARYRDPKSGKTWSGFGRVPGWLASARNRDAFLVNAGPASRPKPQASAVPHGVAARAAQPAAKKADGKTAVKKAPAKKAVAKKATAKKAVPGRPGRRQRGRTVTAGRRQASNQQRCLRRRSSRLHPSDPAVPSWTAVEECEGSSARGRIAEPVKLLISAALRSRFGHVVSEFGAVDQPTCVAIRQSRAKFRPACAGRGEPAPVQWTPRSAKSVIHGRPVRSLATNREPAVGG